MHAEMLVLLAVSCRLDIIALFTEDLSYSTTTNNNATVFKVLQC